MHECLRRVAALACAGAVLVCGVSATAAAAGTPASAGSVAGSAAGPGVAGPGARAVGAMGAGGLVGVAGHAALRMGVQARAARCSRPLARGRTLAEVPWPQRRYDVARIGELADGEGVTVAVLDSGVDDTNPQLRGQVLVGRDVLDGGDGRLDCVGHGTAVASIVAARARTGSGLRGLAPGVKVLPIRVTENREGDASGEPRGTTADVVEGIRAAIDARADVLNLSMSMGDDPALRQVIADALDADIVVVAAVGNDHAKGDPTPYPAAYDGVIGVGAMNADGTRVDASQVGSYVDIVAPGGSVIGAWPGGGNATWSGTSFAAPFVAATAALLRQYRKDLSQREIARRLVATADPAPAGRPSNEYGFGVLNPLRALTDVLPAGAPRPSPAATPAAPAATHDASGARRSTVIGVAGALMALALTVAGVAAMVPMGRRRRWRPGGPTGES